MPSPLEVQRHSLQGVLAPGATGLRVELKTCAQLEDSVDDLVVGFYLSLECLVESKQMVRSVTNVRNAL